MRRSCGVNAIATRICELSTSNATSSSTPEAWVSTIDDLSEIETSLIPFGMHVIGSPLSAERAETVAAIAQAGGADEIDQIDWIVFSLLEIARAEWATRGASRCSGRYRVACRSLG